MAYVSSGERIGIKKGIQQGMQHGEALALQKLLVRRFGTLPASVVERIANARAELLEVWLDRVLDAPNLDALFDLTGN